MPITLTLVADTVVEFDGLVARFARDSSLVLGPEITATDVKEREAEVAKPKGRGKAKTEEVAATPAAGSDAVDPFASEPQESRSGEASPATSISDGEVTIQHLKDAMNALLKATSAGNAQKVLEAASGCKSLSSGTPNVVEKAKDDPALMRVVLDALTAAAAQPAA